jgi:hypothetical protein
MAVIIPYEEISYHKSQIESADPESIKRSLQKLCALYRAGRRLSAIDVHALEVVVVGRLETMMGSPKVVRWCLNFLAFVGSSLSTDSVIRAAAKHSRDELIVAAAVSALCSIHRAEERPWEKIEGVEPVVRLLAALQHLPRNRIDNLESVVHVDKASPAILELALVLVGLGRAPEKIFDPRHSNASIVKVLGDHDDDLVKQYSVWAANENPALGLAALGIPLKELAAQPKNVRAWMYQLVICCAPANWELISILEQGSRDPEESVRAGASRGLANRYEDGFEPITVDWLVEETSAECQRNLERHIVQYANDVPAYRSFSIEWFDRLPEGGVGRKNMFAAAKSTNMFAEFKKLELSKTLEMFPNSGGKQVTYNVNIGTAGQVSIGASSINTGIIEIKEASDGIEQLKAALAQLEAKLDESGLTADQKEQLTSLAAKFTNKPNKSNTKGLLGHLRGLNSMVVGTVTTSEAWSSALQFAGDIAEKLLDFF